MDTKSINKSLPVYRIVIDETDDTGCTAISLVDQPAVEIPFLRFDKDERLELSVNEEKRIISGIAMLADTPIYRNSQKRGEFYIVFDKDTIRTMVEKYSKNQNFNIVNLQHNNNVFVDGCHMIESIIIDKERGICPIEFKDVPDGSWYVSYHVEDEALWDAIKNSGELNGFSIEIETKLELIELNKIEDNSMKKLFKLAKMILKLSEVKTDKATLIYDGELEVGTAVFIEAENGEPMPAADGEYVLEDGTVIVVLEGLVSEIRPIEAPVEEALEEETPAEEIKDDEKEIKIAELEAKVADLESQIAEKDAKITELEAKIAEQEEKLKMSVDTPVVKKGQVRNVTNKALKYF